MKDGQFKTEFSSEPVYKIQSIRREDAGVYQCVARNAVGSIFSDQVQVLVACKYTITLFLFYASVILENECFCRFHLPVPLGSFKCSFIFFHFSIDMSPFNEQSETSLTVQAGEAAVLEVQAVESQPKPAVTWEAEDGSPTYGHKYAVGPDNQLVILSVSDNDAKLYR